MHTTAIQNSLLLLFLFAWTVTMAQAPGWTGIKLFASRSFDMGQAICVDKDDNYYITGTFQNASSNGDDSLIVECRKIASPQQNTINGFLLRFDSTRKLTLKLTIPYGLIGQLVVDDLGYLYVTGAINGGVQREGFLSKYTPKGELVWTQLVQSSGGGYPDDDVITSIDRSQDGALVITGFSNGQQVSLFDRLVEGPINFITKVTAQGRMEWIHNFSSSLGMGATKAIFDKNGDVLIAGNEIDKTSANMSASIAKLNGSTGDIIWKKIFSSSRNYVPWMRSIGYSGNTYVFSGQFGGALTINDTTLRSAGGLDIFVLQCDTAGHINWIVQGGSPGKDIVYSQATAPDGTTYITGGFSDGFHMDANTLTSKGNTDVYVMALDEKGHVSWIRTGGSHITGHTGDLFYDEQGAGIVLDSKHQVQVVGTTIGSGAFGSLSFEAPEEMRQNAFWLTLGNRDTTLRVSYPCTPKPQTDTTITLNVYPNPYSNNLIISNTSSTVLDYDLELYNTLGQLLDNKFYYASTITISAWGRFPMGLYILKIKAGNLSQTFKIIKH